MRNILVFIRGRSLFEDRLLLEEIYSLSHLLYTLDTGRKLNENKTFKKMSSERLVKYLPDRFFTKFN